MIFQGILAIINIFNNFLGLIPCHQLTWLFFLSDCGDLLLASCSQDCFIRLWRITRDKPEESSSIKLKGNIFTVSYKGKDVPRGVVLLSVANSNIQCFNTLMNCFRLWCMPFILNLFWFYRYRSQVRCHLGILASWPWTVDIWCTLAASNIFRLLNL